MSQKKVKYAVIPAAGKGTRFLPETKAVPKELLPIVDTPIIQLNIEEVKKAGIETVVVITGKGKDGIRDHFDYDHALERKLVSEGKHELAQRLHEMCDLVNIVSVRQQEQKGLGHAIWCTKSIIGNEPFAVLLGDDLVLNTEVPCTAQMIKQFETHQKSVVALMEVAEQQVKKFGICAGEQVEGDPRAVRVTEMVEKPDPSAAPSRDAIVGRYILTPEIFPVLDEMVTNSETGAGGEIQLTDALAKLSASQGVMGYRFEGDRFDAGSHDGWLMANLCMAMKRGAIAETLLPYMQKLVQEYEGKYTKAA